MYGVKRTVYDVRFGEGQSQSTLLLRLCDSVASLVLILHTNERKANLFGYTLWIQNIIYLVALQQEKLW